MKLIKPSYKIISRPSNPLGLIEEAGRTCYKSEDRITEDSCVEFCKKIIKRGHLSVIEHVSMTVKFVVDRGVSHEIVRHRLASYSQESTRYCNYEDKITFIIPPWENIRPGVYRSRNNYLYIQSTWFFSMVNVEASYLRMISEGKTPQQARSVLPNSTKTELVVTANFREWRHIFKLRCASAAHPQMREVMIPLRDEVRKMVPVIFDEE